MDLETSSQDVVKEKESSPSTISETVKNRRSSNKNPVDLETSSQDVVKEKESLPRKSSTISETVKDRRSSNKNPVDLETSSQDVVKEKESSPRKTSTISETVKDRRSSSKNQVDLETSSQDVVKERESSPRKTSTISETVKDRRSSNKNPVDLETSSQDVVKEKESPPRKTSTISETVKDRRSSNKNPVDLETSSQDVLQEEESTPCKKSTVSEKVKVIVTRSSKRKSMDMANPNQDSASLVCKKVKSTNEKILDLKSLNQDVIIKKDSNLRNDSMVPNKVKSTNEKILDLKSSNQDAIIKKDSNLSNDSMLPNKEIVTRSSKRKSMVMANSNQDSASVVSKKVKDTNQKVLDLKSSNQDIIIKKDSNLSNDTMVPNKVSNSPNKNPVDLETSSKVFAKGEESTPRKNNTFSEKVKDRRSSNKNPLDLETPSQDVVKEKESSPRKISTVSKKVKDKCSPNENPLDLEKSSQVFVKEKESSPRKISTVSKKVKDKCSPNENPLDLETSSQVLVKEKESTPRENSTVFEKLKVTRSSKRKSMDLTNPNQDSASPEVSPVSKKVKVSDQQVLDIKPSNQDSIINKDSNLSSDSLIPNKGRTRLSNQKKILEKEKSNQQNLVTMKNCKVVLHESKVIITSNEQKKVTLYLTSIKCLYVASPLNDEIIDFYLNYILTRKTPSDYDASKTHLFSAFLYTTLSNQFTAGQKFLKLRQVNLFSKDYVVFPIYGHIPATSTSKEFCHWFLAIVCNLRQLTSQNETKNLRRHKKQSATPVKLEVKKDGPCILIFNSLSTPRLEIKCNTVIREFLKNEWKHISETPFNNLPMKTVKCPEQKDETSCGLFLLHFMECFFQNPLKVISEESINSEMHLPTKRKIIENDITKLFL